jgi:ATP-dependent Lon protease
MSMVDQDTELIPLMTNEDEDNLKDEDIPGLIPILPLRNTVLFPGVVIPITVGRDKSIKLIRDAHKGNKIVGVVTQFDGDIEDPAPKDLNSVGTVAQILKMLRMPDGNTTVIIHGKKRFHLREMVSNDPYFKANIELIPDP